MRTVFFDAGFRMDDVNIRWADPAYLLEKGDPGWVNDPNSASYVPPKTKPRKRSYMASNPTPTTLGELISAGEDMCDGLTQHAALIGIKQNTFAVTRAELDALIAAKAAVQAADGTQQPEAFAASRIADSNTKGFITRAIKVLSIGLGNEWSDAWLATGLPNNTVGVPRKQDDRFTALGGLKAYFAANPGKEVAALDVTAAIAETLYQALSTARQGAGNALKASGDAHKAIEEARAAFRERFRGVVTELEQLLEDDDARWYDFGLNRPNDPAQPGQPANVHCTVLGGGRVLVQIDGARRANSFNYYRQITALPDGTPGTPDAEPVKVINTEGTQHTIEALPAGATVEFTVTGVNDAGEGQPSAPVSVVVG